MLTKIKYDQRITYSKPSDKLTAVLREYSYIDRLSNTWNEERRLLIEMAIPSIPGCRVRVEEFNTKAGGKFDRTHVALSYLETASAEDLEILRGLIAFAFE